MSNIIDFDTGQPVDFDIPNEELIDQVGLVYEHMEKTMAQLYVLLTLRKAMTQHQNDRMALVRDKQRLLLAALRTTLFELGVEINGDSNDGA